MSGYLHFYAQHPAIALIAEKLNESGNAFHNTADWQDETDYLGGKSACDIVQEALNAADEAFNTLAAAEGGDGTPDQSVMEVVSTVEDIVTAARLTQFYDDPIYKPWSEQVWRSVDTARRTIATRRKVLEAIAEQRNALAARVRELEQFQLERQSAEYLDSERYRYLRDRADENSDGPIICSGLGDNFDFLRGPECDEEIDAARSK